MLPSLPIRKTHYHLRTLPNFDWGFLVDWLIFGGFFWTFFFVQYLSPVEFFGDMAKEFLGKLDWEDIYFAHTSGKDYWI